MIVLIILGTLIGIWALICICMAGYMLWVAQPNQRKIALEIALVMFIAPFDAATDWLKEKCASKDS